MKEYKCKKCGHEWVPRISKPKACPRCNSRTWEKEKKTKK
jgi:DNA-directed RNA polymerase subunit RPC12/RpoP